MKELKRANYGAALGESSVSALCSGKAILGRVALAQGIVFREKSLERKKHHKVNLKKKRSELDGKRETECNESSETDGCIFASENDSFDVQGARENICRDVQGEAKTFERKRSRNYRVRHFGGCVGGHCYLGYNGFSSENPRALGCDSRRHKRFVVLRLRACFAVRLHACFTGRFVSVARLKNVSCETLHACFSRRFSSASGQGTVEYALVMAALLSIVIGLGALWRVFDAGILVEHALASASHHMQAVTPGAVADVFIY
jgi:hypothetical protein